MFELSIPSPKRRCTESAETDFAPKKLKFEDLHVVHVKTELQLEPQLSSEIDERNRKKAIGLASLILNGQKKNVQIYPGQIVWCRLEKSPFWPAIVWSTKTGKITDDRRRVLVKFFAKKDANVWIKWQNAFPFDGLESFENMKNSLDVQLMTAAMSREFDFAFNITSEVWPRAVAEAIYCTNKDREERLALFIVFISSSKVNRARRIPLRRRSLELNISDSCCREKDFRGNVEINRVQSFIEGISFPIAETSTNSEKIQKTVHVEQMLLKFVTESGFVGVDKICINCMTHRSAQRLIKCAGTCAGFLRRKCSENRFPRRLVDADNAGGSNYLICKNCADRSKRLVNLQNRRR